MSNTTLILDDILHGPLRPWLEDDGSDEKYFARNARLKESIPAEPLQYTLNFPRPFNNKTKYYQKLITNAIAEYSHQIITLIKEDDDENLIRYWLNDTLEKNLKTRLRQVGELLKEKDFSPTYLSNSYIPDAEGEEHKANTYIMQLLKLAYMQLFLEVQEAFLQYRDDIMIPEDFYSQLLREPIPATIPVKKTITLEVEPVRPPAAKSTKTEVSAAANSFTYKQYDLGNEKLKDAFDRLRSKGFIEENTIYQSFKRIFSGKEVTNPVMWIANQSDLYYFIKLLYLEHKLLLNLKQKQWEVAQKCFIDQDGNPFDMQKIRLLKKPASTAAELEFIVLKMK